MVADVQLHVVCCCICIWSATSVMPYLRLAHLRHFSNACLRARRSQGPDPALMCTCNSDLAAASPPGLHAAYFWLKPLCKCIAAFVLLQVSVLALTAIQYVQSVKTQISSETHPAVEKAMRHVIPTLQDLLLKVLLPHLADPGANMTQVYHDGLPVLLGCLRDSPAIEDMYKLDCLIEVLMDHMVTLNDFTLPEERTTSDRLLQAILFMVKESPAD